MSRPYGSHFDVSYSMKRYVQNIKECFDGLGTVLSVIGRKKTYQDLDVTCVGFLSIMSAY